jgi:nicotinic acetylcholine receptor
MLIKLFLLATALSAVLASSADKQKLLADLMKDYMKAVEPDDTPLKMAISYVCASLNKETHELTSKLLEKYTWQDNRLKWNPDEHGGITQMRIPAKMLWTPDVKLYTAKNEEEVRDEVNTVAMSNGTVLWMPMVAYKTYCSPASDESEDRASTCQIKIGSWTYDADTLDLQLDGDGFDTFMYIDSCPYTIQDPKVKIDSQQYPCCPEKYASMHIEFKVAPRQ